MTIKYGTIKLNVIGHNSEFELENIINAFRPYMNLQKTDYVVESKVEGTRVSSILLADTSVVESYTIEVESQDLTRQALKKSLYKVLSNFIGKDIPWGVLTGIRPTKIVHNYKKKGLTESTIKTKLIEEYCISREKADLMIDVARKEEEVLYQNKEGEISIYIGIPFCPTRCLYCSFTSYSLKEKGQLVDAYLDALVREMRYVSSRIKANTIRSIYIGGGTPTSLNDRQLEKLLKEVDKCFNIGEIEEYTIEAGRPDTLNRNKLRLMKKHNVDRISINPQTMRQETLKTIGRSHSVEDIKNVFNMAREEGHQNINMDLIIGLPGETSEDISYTMEEVKKLKPESITVHAMAIKRASRLREEIEEYDLTKSATIQKMLEITSRGASKMGMIPYYMYRQKDTLGNLENIGYALPGKESIYNIQMIAEQQTIIAIGAGAVTKEVTDKGNKIKRIPNVRNVEEYIRRIDEMIERKCMVGTVHK